MAVAVWLGCFLFLHSCWRLALQGLVLSEDVANRAKLESEAVSAYVLFRVRVTCVCARAWVCVCVCVDWWVPTYIRPLPK